MNDASKKTWMRYLPYAIGAILVVQFAGLGAWQIYRGMHKQAEQTAFDSQAGFAAWFDGMELRSFQRLKVTGNFDADHQFLLENIVVNSRNGYYVITPLVVGADAPVLMVNRGWIERAARDFDATAIELTAPRVTVRGRVGALPRPGFRMGEAIAPGSTWPMPAVYPTLDDISRALDRPVQPFVLLMDPDDEFGYDRDWVPNEIGPARHFAYALQWFAMSVVLAGLLVWHYRKRSFEA